MIVSPRRKNMHYNEDLIYELFIFLLKGESNGKN